MNFSEGGVAGVSDPLRLSWQPKLRRPSLIVGWSADAGRLGAKVADYLNRKLGGQAFCEIEPEEFFTLGGVTIEGDVVQFPGSEFCACPEKDLVVFRSDPPSYEYHKFLSLMLDVAEHYCHVKELLTIGGMISLSAHTSPRELTGVFNSLELREALSHYNLSVGMNYETPSGQRPTLSSFLLWAAKRRNIPAASLWVPIPFYLTAVDDPEAEKRVLEFLSQRFALEIDFSDLNEEIRQRNQILAQVRRDLPAIDESINKLESNLRLSDEETETLVNTVEKFLREK